MGTLGSNIKMYRMQKKLSQRELAMKIRVGTGTIEKYESGAQLPDTQTILKISTVLDIPAPELLEQIYQINSGFDEEIEHLIKEVGTEKSKLILRKAKEFSEEDFLKVMQMLYDIKYEQK
ncbi:MULTISPECIES: helix-turn-helix transcriptional regulator [Bacillaceae]|uniref:helix-turn-helix domain-containing protein n=1 Tax=Bacillaceae TaxID=186817 RepID=UPI001BDE8600|nr:MULTISPECIES: helix-turn-helix transcriptional regulator [Bacillaceae]MDX8360907.1 helix-turn-helix transcriptional regulator [Cytobacillus sp. IB215316]MDX8365889.1 helix-turn-helix transcriptional regulator [Cytobacillus sp. IB215665]